MKQYYLFDDNNKFLTTNYYDAKPHNSTEVAPMVATEYAEWNSTTWIDSRGDNYTPVPQSVTAIQFLTQMEIQGINEDSILSIINSLPSPNNILAKNSFFRASNFERSNPLLAIVANNLGLTEVQIDELFINAIKL